MMNFGLDIWWVFPALIAAGMLTVAGFIFYRTQTRHTKTANTVLVANSYRVRNTPAYQKALRKLWVQMLAGGVMLTLLAGLAAFGASKPVSVEVITPEKHNRDIVLCLDASGSMFDVDTDILLKFQELVDGFRGERIALTIFNATGMQIFPLTDDYEYVQQNLEKMVTVFQNAWTDPESTTFLAPTLGREEGASLIGDGLYGCSLNFDFQEDTTRSRSIILATDNVVNGTELVPLDDAAQTSADENIRVYGINPGSRGETGYVPDSAINQMQTAVETTGGQFFLLSDGAVVSSIIDSISATETSLIVGSPIIVRTDTPDLYLYLLAGGLIVVFGYLIWRRL